MDCGDKNDGSSWHIWNIYHDHPDGLTHGGIIETIDACADGDAEMDPNASRLQRIQDTLEIIPEHNNENMNLD
jgi:hypothetical protein